MITLSPPWGKKRFLTNFFFRLECFLQSLHRYFSQTQSLPKLNTLDLSLVNAIFIIRKSAWIQDYFSKKKISNKYFLGSSILNRHFLDHTYFIHNDFFIQIFLHQNFLGTFFCSIPLIVPAVIHLHIFSDTHPMVEYSQFSLDIERHATRALLGRVGGRAPSYVVLLVLNTWHRR